MAKLNKKTSTSKQMKSLGAGSSRTNRKGETTFYKSSKDAPGYNDSFEGKGTMSPGNAPIARFDAKGKQLSTIPAKMTPENPAKLPGAPNVPNIGDVLGAGNAGLASTVQGMTYDAKTGQFSPNPASPIDNFQSLFEQATQLGNQAFQEMGSDEERMRKLEKENQIKQKQQAVTDFTSQLNQIVAQRDADILRVEGQGRGIPEVIIGGQQSQIQKEAAIAALPIQAQLATAQGALELAQNHVDKMFQIQSQDALAKYQYKSKLIDSVYTFATAQEQRRLDTLKQKEDRDYDMQKTNLAYQRQLASEATSYGLGGVAASILKLDPKSPTFNQDVASLQGRVVKPSVGVSSGWELKEVNGESVWVNTKTQEIKPISSTSGNMRSLSFEENAKFNATPEAKAIKDATNYAEAVKNYKEAIQTYGTGEVFGRGKGALNEAYSSLVGATKDYYTLGTYDNGVQKLIALGIPEPSVFGIAVNRVGALDSAMATAKDKIGRNVEQLQSTRYGNTNEFNQLVNNATKVIGKVPSQSVNWGLFQDDDKEELKSLGVQVSASTNYVSNLFNQ